MVDTPYLATGNPPVFDSEKVLRKEMYYLNQCGHFNGDAEAKCIKWPKKYIPGDISTILKTTNGTTSKDLEARSA
jgi:hypothetical protein